MYERCLFSGGTDLKAMSCLALDYPQQHIHYIDLPYRFTSPAMSETKNIGLWKDNQGKLAGWAVMQLPFWMVDITCRPDAEASLYPLILQWVDQRATELITEGSEHTSWYLTLFPEQRDRIEMIEKFGFSSQANVAVEPWNKVWLKHDGFDALPEQRQLSGFTIRAMKGIDEVDAYVSLHQDVFKSKNMNREWRLGTLHQPDYNSELDLVLQDEFGNLCGFFIAWMANVRGELCGQIEPTGIGSAYRRAGLGGAILIEGIRRLYELGAQKVYVETDFSNFPARSLYETVGFCLQSIMPVFRKDYSVP